MGLADFQAKLHIHRRQTGLNQKQLAKLVGFAASSFSQKLTGYWGGFSVEEVCAIIRVLAQHQPKGLTTYQEASDLLRALHPGATLDATNWQEGQLSQSAKSPKVKSKSKNIPTALLTLVNLAPETLNLAPLPARPQTLVGREQEITQLIELLTYPNIRLVTLKGMGGIGKTSLGIEALHRLASPDRANSVFPDGIVFVDLVEAKNTGLMIAGILEAVGSKLPASGSEISPPDTLVNYLTAKSMLIMLDNFEQLLAVGVGSGELAENPRLFLNNLLNAAPGLKLLVTSRERLRLQGEQVFEVEGLGYPDLGTGATSSSSETALLQEYPAVKLFVEIAKSSDKKFKLTAENLQAVCQVCYYLDGSPHSIGLAASRSYEYSPALMLADFLARGRGSNREQVGTTGERRSNSLELTAQGLASLPKRQQSSENSLDWSYSLLDQKERDVLRRLAVFEGGFTIEAVARVCAGLVNSSREAGQLVSSLVIKSLVKPVDGRTEARYTLSVLTQDYGLYLLDNLGELETAREQHAGYFLGLAREAEPHLSGSSRAIWQEKLKREYANLTEALGWLADKNKVNEATELAAVLGNFAVGAGGNYRDDAKRWLQKVLGMWVEAMPAKKTKALVKLGVRAKALHQAGRIAVSEKDNWHAQSYFEKAVELWRETGNLPGLGLSLLGLGNVAYSRKNYKGAAKLYIEAEALTRQTSEKYSLAVALNSLANIAIISQEYTEAKKRYHEVIVLKKELADIAGVALALKNLAIIAFKEQDLDTVQSYTCESMELYEKLKRKADNVPNLYNLGLVEHFQNNFQLAQNYYKQSLKLSIETSNFYYVPVIINKVAAILTKGSNSNLLDAAKIYGMLEKTLETNSNLFDSSDRLDYNAGVSLLEQYLSKEVRGTAWLEGREIGLDLRNAALITLSALETTITTDNYSKSG